MFRLLLALIVIGGVLVFLGFQEMRLASAAKPDPQTIKCADLIASGPGENAHVVLTDYVMCDFAFVYEGQEGGKTWTNVWVPVVPLGGEFHQEVLKLVAEGKDLSNIPMPRDIRVIVKSSHVENEGALASLAGKDTIQGMIVNKISSLGSKEKKILTESYPGVNFDNVYILEHDRTPASGAKSFGMMGGGAVLALMGVVGFVKRAKA